MTPLCLCILHNNLAMAKRLYGAGASPLPSRNNSESVMCFAALAQNPDMIRWLVSLNFRTRMSNPSCLCPSTCLRNDPTPQTDPLEDPHPN